MLVLIAGLNNNAGSGLAASALPPVQAASAMLSLATAQSLSTGNAPTAQNVTTGTPFPSYIGLWNRNATELDLSMRFGGGASRAVCFGLGLSIVPSTLQITVAPGQARIDGIAELSAASTVTLTDASQSYVWLLQSGVLQVVANSTTPPATPACYLGRATTAGGVVTALDTSGVQRVVGGVTYRNTADAYTPSDSLPSSVGLFTRTAVGLWWWDGGQHNLIGGRVFSGSVTGAPSASLVILRGVSGGAWSLPANLTGCALVAGTAATASTVFNVQKNGSTVGTFTLAAGGTIATGATTGGGAIAFAASDVLTVVSPGSPDATAANIAVSIVWA